LPPPNVGNWPSMSLECYDSSLPWNTAQHMPCRLPPGLSAWIEMPNFWGKLGISPLIHRLIFPSRLICISSPGGRHAPCKASRRREEQGQHITTSTASKTRSKLVPISTNYIYYPNSRAPTAAALSHTPVILRICMQGGPKTNRQSL
jgi:hypothetical protein